MKNEDEEFRIQDLSKAEIIDIYEELVSENRESDKRSNKTYMLIENIPNGTYYFHEREGIIRDWVLDFITPGGRIFTIEAASKKQCLERIIKKISPCNTK